MPRQDNAADGGGQRVDRERLARILGLLGSNHSGEVLAAARQAKKMRKAANLTWAEILIPAALPEPIRECKIETAEDAVSYCLERPWVLTSWEQNFLHSIARRPWALRPKQTAVLVQLLQKCRVAQARAA